MNIYSTLFKTAWNYLKENEGGYSNDKYDRGGSTKYGVSLRFLIGTGEGDLNGDGKVDEQDIQILDETEAQRMYKQYFWLPCKCNKIEDPNIAIKIFDMAVNFGVKRAGQIAQNAINQLVYMPPLKCDGVIGAKTLEAINTVSSERLMRELCSESEKYYNEIVKVDPTQGRFLRGWVRRAVRRPSI